jgi:hypothetical protein
MKTFAFCDDWFIFAREGEDLYYVNTEAVARYMLPIAFKRWDQLTWTRFERNRSGRLRQQGGERQDAEAGPGIPEHPHTGRQTS